MAACVSCVNVSDGAAAVGHDASSSAICKLEGSWATHKAAGCGTCHSEQFPQPVTLGTATLR